MKTIELSPDEYIFGIQTPSYEGSSNLFVPKSYQMDEPVIITESYTPIAEVQQFIPAFPDYSKMSCEELGKEITDLNNILMTSRFSESVRIAYENALSDARDRYIVCTKVANPEVPSPATPVAGEVFVDDNKSSVETQVPSAQANPTFVDDKKVTTTATPAVATTPTALKGNSYLYAGLGIVAILIIANMLKKNTNA